MRSRRPSQEHTDAVARRLAELSAQLADARAPATSLDPAVGDEWWSEHTRVVPRTPLSVVPAMAEDPSDDEEPPEEPTPGLAPPTGSVAPSPRAMLRPSPLPVPGRHAARRPWAWAPDLVPQPLRGRARLGGPQLTAVAVLVALGLAVTCWWVVRADPEPPVPVALEPQLGAEAGVPIVPPSAGSASERPTSQAAAPSGQADPAAPAEVVVDVAGRVRRPGIVVLDAGARVVDALEQAGGARDGVDLASLNLARVLVDGEQIVVGSEQPATAAPAPPVPPVGAPGAPTALVDLNLADQTMLETLPNVGPVTAGSIIAWRTEHGGFTAVTELLEVDGIGDTTLAQLTPYVTV